MPTPALPDDPSAVAVLCIECQNGVMGPESVLPVLAADSGELVANLRRLLDAARDAGLQVLHATYEGPLGGHNTGTARLWRALDRATAGWSPGAAPTQVVPELLAPTDVVLPRHHGLFPTLGSELLPVLRNLGVRTVVLAGVSLNLALPHTAGHLTQSGFQLIIPTDAVGGTPPQYAEQVLTYTMALLGRLATVDDLVAEWQPASGQGAE